MNIRTGIVPVLLALSVTVVAVGCFWSGDGAADREAAALTAIEQRELETAQHMTAEATLAAHYVAAAVAAGHSRAQINATLAQVAGGTIIDEFWVSDAVGDIEFGNIPNSGFTFNTDPAAYTQSAPFSRILTGEKLLVIQPPLPRELDGKVFRYVAVRGVDATRIVQIGISEQ